MDTRHLGVLQALVYADVFDFPLTLPEVHRYAVGVHLSRNEVAELLHPASSLAPFVHRDGDFFMLAGRAELAERRRQRAAASQRLWQRALMYARLLAALPFVRMVALTGALAVDNADANDDIDFFIVTEPGSLWLCRALVIVLVRMAATQGDTLCPNYFLTTAALALDDHSLFTAHELAQMVPLAGMDVYTHMRRLNAWSFAFLPNAEGPPRCAPLFAPSRWTRWGEAILRTPVGRWLEQWEQTRKIRQFSRQGHGIPEVHFSEHHCKGHFSQHGHRAMHIFWQRWADVAQALGVQVEQVERTE